MAEEVERLVVVPFREILEKANVAVQNAKEAGPDGAATMLEAAQRLAKEGERAMKRIEPLCKKNFEEYGSNFVDKIKEDDDIARHRGELEDLLWDFDDYVAADDFDLEKFEELQKASRNAAPRIVDILKRMKLTRPPLEKRRSANSAGTVRPKGVTLNDGPAPSEKEKAIKEVEAQLSHMMGAQAGPDQGLDGGDPTPRPSVVASTAMATTPKAELERTVSHRSEASEALEPPPPPPLSNPWEVGRLPPMSPVSDQGVGPGPLERRPPVAPGADSPTVPGVLPLIPPGNIVGAPSSQQSAPSRSVPEAYQEDSKPAPSSPLPSERQLTGAADPSSPVEARSPAPSFTHAYDAARTSQSHSTEPTHNSTRRSLQPPSNSSNVTVTPLGPSTIPEHSAVTTYDSSQPSLDISLPIQGASASTIYKHTPRQQSTDSFNSSIFDTIHNDGASVSSTNRSSSVLSYTTPSSPFSATQPGQGQHLPAYQKSMSPVEQGHSGYNSASLTQQPPPVYQTHLSPMSPANPGEPAYSTVYPAIPRPPIHEHPAFAQTAPFSPHSSADVRSPIDNPASPVANSMAHLAPAGLEAVFPSSPGETGIQCDVGLIPVESEWEPKQPERQADCVIGPNSSFYQLKGFCKGAEEITRGERTFRQVTRPVGGYSMTKVAKCKHCLFELDWKSVEQDQNNDSKGNFTSQSLGFRIRILQKSHMAHNRIDEPLYACQFCIREGRTTEESDATVFFSHGQLFAHMARHSRPLPAVPGLTVIDGVPMPPQSADNFDLWFPNAPLPSVMAGIRRETAAMPSGTATETRKNANGILRTPPDRATALQFAAGAKIVGIEFPPRYQGKWGVGWHDGIRGAFEAESVDLDPPSVSEVRSQAPVGKQAVVAWRFKQSGEGSWLKLSKGDVIKNISWSHEGHWCYSGTTAKGWGIFPASHIDPVSLRDMDTAGDDRASVTSSERRLSSALSRFSIRKPATHAKAPVVSASVSGNGSLLTRRTTDHVV